MHFWFSCLSDMVSHVLLRVSVHVAVAGFTKSCTPPSQTHRSFLLTTTQGLAVRRHTGRVKMSSTNEVCDGRSRPYNAAVFRRMLSSLIRANSLFCPPRRPSNAAPLRVITRPPRARLKAQPRFGTVFAFPLGVTICAASINENPAMGITRVKTAPCVQEITAATVRLSSG